MLVIKRDESEVEFNSDKITEAIFRAMKEVKKEKPKIRNGGISFDDRLRRKAKRNTDRVLSYIKTHYQDKISVEDIQDIVVDVLLDRDRETGKAYIEYRSKHKIKRDLKNTTDKAIMEMLNGKSEYWLTENSNKNALVVTTQRDYIAGITSKDITKRLLLPKHITEAHDAGIIHNHDEDYYIQNITNCSLTNLKDMLGYGTVMNGKKIFPSHRIEVAMTVATQIITAVSSSQFGGQTINLSHLAPFVRKSYYECLEENKQKGLTGKKLEEWTKRDLKKCIKNSVQTFNYQINSMNTTNGQAPFISVFMYLSDDAEYKEETAMLIEEFLLQRIQGMPNEKGEFVTQAFPKLLYVLEEDNMHDNKYKYLTNLAAKCASFRLAPDFISEKKMKEVKNGDVYGCMG